MTKEEITSAKSGTVLKHTGMRSIRPYVHIIHHFLNLTIMNPRLKVILRVGALILLSLLLLASAFGQSAEPPPGLPQTKSMTVCTGAQQDTFELGYATTYSIDENLEWHVFDATAIKNGERLMNSYFWLVMRVNNRTSVIELAVVSDNVWDWDLPTLTNLNDLYLATPGSFLEFQSAGSEFNSPTVYGIEQAPFKSPAPKGAELALYKRDLIP